MKNNFLSFIKNSLFYFIFFSTCLFNAIPLVRINSLALLFPSFCYMILFHFFILRNEVKIPYFIIFIFSLVVDFSSGFYLGFTALIWLLLLKIMFFIRVHLVTLENFMYTIRDYLCFVIISLFLKWSIISILDKTTYPFTPLLKNFLLDVIFYIIFYKFFNFLRKVLLNG